METSANIITTMGIIANEVYDEGQVKKYFKDNPENLVANGTTYTVIEHTNDSTWDGFNALLLQDTTTGDYVVSFRGTEPPSPSDWITNLFSGVFDFNVQYYFALVFVRQAMEDHNILPSQLTLTGHSLGGILTQQIGARLGIKGYAFNPWGTSDLVSHESYLEILYKKTLEVVGAYTPQAETFLKENILNISFNDFGTINGDILSNGLTGIISEHVGNYLPIFGTDLDLLNGHSMPKLNEAIAHYNEVLKNFLAYNLPKNQNQWF